MPSISSWDSTAPLVIAHRGASAYAPENTLASFRRAVEMGADAVEMDAKLTRDGQVVILHDRNLDRTTQGSGLLKNVRYEEIRRLDAGSHFSPDFKSERIPTLEEVLTELGEAILMNIELTNYGSPWDDLPQRVVRIVSGLGLTAEVMLSSFNPLVLLACRRSDKDILTGMLVHPGLPRLISNVYRWIGKFDFLLPHESLIKKSHARWGEKTIAWTVNHSGRMRELLTIGIAGIITDVPDVALTVRAKLSGRLVP